MKEKNLTIRSQPAQWQEPSNESYGKGSTFSDNLRRGLSLISGYRSIKSQPQFGYTISRSYNLYQSYHSKVFSWIRLYFSWFKKASNIQGIRTKPQSNLITSLIELGT